MRGVGWGEVECGVGAQVGAGAGAVSGDTVLMNMNIHHGSFYQPHVWPPQVTSPSQPLAAQASG